MTTNTVSAQWLAQQLDHKQLVIVDCRFRLADPQWGYQQYLHSHIPGAYYLHLDQDLSSPVSTHGGRHPLPNPEHFAAKLANLGINQGETLVVAYDDFRFAFASRVWWLLRYLGHSQVAVLDGGWQGWLKGNYPVTNIVPLPQCGEFIPQPHPDWIVDLETVKVSQDQPQTILVDSRDNYRYLGMSEPIDPIAGHIPGAINLPWKAVTNEQGYCLPLKEQQQRWQPYQSAPEIIVYCGSGVTACVNLLSLSVAGIDHGKLYPGGWSDWCSYLR